MKRTIIMMDECGRVAVPSDATNVWMSEMELVRLFDTIAPTLRAAIRAVYRSGVLQPCEVERCIRLPNGYFAEVYALPWSWHLLSVSTRPMPQGYAMPCWKGCACEKEGKSCWFLWEVIPYADVKLYLLATFTSCLLAV